MKYRPVIVNRDGKVTDEYRTALATREEAVEKIKAMERVLDYFRSITGDRSLSCAIREEPTGGR